MQRRREKKAVDREEHSNEVLDKSPRSQFAVHVQNAPRKRQSDNIGRPRRITWAGVCQNAGFSSICDHADASRNDPFYLG